MRDNEILSTISALVDEEHELRSKLRNGELAGYEENERVKQLEVALDQCWDLLRQRRARRGAGAAGRARTGRRHGGPDGGRRLHADGLAAELLLLEVHELGDEADVRGDALAALEDEGVRARERPVVRVDEVGHDGGD